MATEAVNSIDGALTRADINILRMIAIGNPEQTLGWKSENEAAFVKLDDLTTELSKNTSETLDVRLTEQLQRDYARLRDGMRHQTNVIQTGDLKAAADINRTEVKPFAEQVFKTLQTLREQGKQNAGKRFEDQKASATSATDLAIGATLVIAAIGIAITMLTIRSILAAIGGTKHSCGYHPHYRAGRFEHDYPDQFSRRYKRCCCCRFNAESITRNPTTDLEFSNSIGGRC